MNAEFAIPVMPSETTSPQTSKPTIPSDVAISLLQRLGSDDQFRDLFKSNPRMALREVGYILPPTATTPMCMMVTELASKREIQHAHDGLHAHLTGAARGAMHVVFTFEHGRIQDVLKAV